MPRATTERRPAGRPERRRTTRSTTRSRWWFLLVAVGVASVTLLALAYANGPASPDPPIVNRSGVVVLRLEDRVVARVRLAPYVSARGVDHRALRAAVARAVPAETTVRRGPASIRYRVGRDQAVAAVGRVGTGGGALTVPAVPIASSIRAPIVRQVLRNDCEMAALEMMLGAAGRRADQLRLLRELPRSGPLDPIVNGTGRVWGDPELGFVGRPEGGGEAGGLGVYQGPVARLAAKHGVRLDNLSGGNVDAIYRRVLSGRPVLAWVGLSDGPYESWRSPAGRQVKVNLGEHTVTLLGVRDGNLLVGNPLTGAREVWSRSRFASAWALLDKRALGQS